MVNLTLIDIHAPALSAAITNQSGSNNLAPQLPTISENPAASEKTRGGKKLPKETIEQIYNTLFPQFQKGKLSIEDVAEQVKINYATARFYLKKRIAAIYS